MCSLNDDLDLPVSLRPRLVTVGRCHGIQERVANVLASWKDKGCADLPLPSCAIAVHSVPTCFDQYGFCGGRKCPGSRLQTDESMQDGGA